MGTWERVLGVLLAGRRIPISHIERSHPPCLPPAPGAVPAPGASVRLARFLFAGDTQNLRSWSCPHRLRATAVADIAAYELLHFLNSCVWQQHAVRVRMSGDQKRHSMFHFAAIEQYDFLVRCAQQVPSLESQTKRRPGD